jgi:hypothetical protein
MSNLSLYVQKVEFFLAQGKLKEALKILYNDLGKGCSYENDTLSALARFNRGNNDMLAGLSDPRDWKIERNRITDSAQNLLADIIAERGITVTSNSNPEKEPISMKQQLENYLEVLEKLITKIRFNKDAEVKKVKAKARELDTEIREYLSKSSLDSGFDPLDEKIETLIKSIQKFEKKSDRIISTFERRAILLIMQALEEVEDAEDMKAALTPVVQQLAGLRPYQFGEYVAQLEGLSDPFAIQNFAAKVAKDVAILKSKMK